MLKTSMGIQYAPDTVVKLLQMKHEDISDLSVTRSEASNVSDNVAINESKDILRLYQLTRQQLHRKIQHWSNI